MKKTTIIGKKQIITAVMILALCAAVWLNVRYTTDGSGFATSQKAADEDLGETAYVANTGVSVAADEEDYFMKARKDRDEKREDELEIIKETLSNSKSSDADKQKARELTEKITNRMESENSAETVIKAKGFEDVIVINSDESCSVVVRKDGELEKSETVKILDAVASATTINAENIKIVAIK